MSSPPIANEDVTMGKTGYNPYRISQFENTDLWLAAGMSQEAADSYLGAIGDSLQSPNMVLDLRIRAPCSTSRSCSISRSPRTLPASKTRPPRCRTSRMALMR